MNARATSVLSNSDGSLDIDGNGELDALTDGLLILREYVRALRSQLTQGAIGDEAIYTDSDDIEARITALGDDLDIDKDGSVDALSDGLIILRYLFGLTDEPLTTGVISDDAQRSSSADIEEYLLQLAALWTLKLLAEKSSTDMCPAPIYLSIKTLIFNKMRVSTVQQQIPMESFRYQ